MFGTPMYWRETQKPVKFLFVDGRVVVVILLMLMHIKLWTFLLALTTVLVVFLFGRKGISMDSIIRFIRATIVGKKRTARGLDAERTVVDYGFETKKTVIDASIALDGRHKAHLIAQNKKNKKAGSAN
ncbi:MAG: IcmT/TraK family protein [Roseibium sp.]|uniref:IcmT/TraK family protein n=1 Tax=Roseibium sp. TaxID=1936156 RepID=UPI00329833E1